MLSEIKAICAEGKHLMGTSNIIGAVGQVLNLLDQNIADGSMRNAAIDIFIKLLEAEKK